ncbi:DUF3015 domain-containing protein [bacterium]|nr:DUF3015 domain-containing protein [bacterium]
MKSLKALFAFLFLFSVSESVLADQYSCAKMVYKDGWLTKYEYLGNTWGANTKKSGVLSSTGGSSIERTTASVDPGVTTGQFMSSLQYSSSWGECSMLEMFITQQFRQDYIEQNIDEIKKQIALGDGHHLDSLAFLSGCYQVERSVWSSQLQENTESFYDMNNVKNFDQKLENVIHSSSHLNQHCKMPGNA